MNWYNSPLLARCRRFAFATEGRAGKSSRDYCREEMNLCSDTVNFAAFESDDLPQANRHATTVARGRDAH